MILSGHERLGKDIIIEPFDIYPNVENLPDLRPL